MARTISAGKVTLIVSVSMALHPSAKNLLPRTRTEHAGFPPPADRPWRSRARRCRGAPSAPLGKAMASVITEPQRPAVPVAGTPDTFPVRRVYCVGRNYAAHAREMGGDPTREPPFFFMKPADTLELVPEARPSSTPTRRRPRTIISRSSSSPSLGKGGKDIPVEKALDCVWGYAVGLDMTRRDLQQQGKGAAPPLGARQGHRQFRPRSARSTRSRRSATRRRARSRSPSTGR